MPQKPGESPEPPAATPGQALRRPIISARLRSRVGCAALVSGAVAISALTALAGAGFLALGRESQALASHVACGDTITTDTRLDSDLINCPNNGIVIGADGVTLDLNGHLIDGDRTPVAACAQNETCDVGVLSEGHDGITVMHGSVREFAFTGVGVAQARHARVLGVSSRRNGGIGILFFRCTRSLVRNSSGNGTEGTGIDLTDSHHNRILHNSFRDNNHAILLAGSTENLIEGNLFSRNSDEGILMEGGDRNQVRRNRSLRGASFITVGPGNRNVIAENTVSGARGDGIRIEKGQGNLVTDNLVIGARRNGIRLGIEHPRLGGVANVVSGNLVRGSGRDGFLVNTKDHQSLLKRNLAVGSGDDGFGVHSRTTTLTANRAVRNADLGIEAVRGVTDGGGNVARGNGDPRQCTNIACR
jgi:parallel beta-helix repeat protein